ncbi:MAG: YARHG domain-containing protein [Acetivibrio sp.]
MKKKSIKQTLGIFVVGGLILLVLGAGVFIYIDAQQGKKSSFHIADILTNEIIEEPEPLEVKMEGFTIKANLEKPVASILEKPIVEGSTAEDPNNEDPYMIQDSNYRYLMKKELDAYTKEELNVARNEIFARHGRIFESEKYQSYFESKNWYYPEYTADEFNQELLNEYEIANAALILEYEKEKGYL